MASSLAISRPAVLLACEDPVAASLLRSLLRALPPPYPEVLTPDPVSAGLEMLAPRASLCFLEIGYAGLALDTVLARLQALAPGLRVIGLLGEHARAGDRAELVRALRSGLEQILMIEELSVATLEELMRPGRAFAAAPVKTMALEQTPLPASGGWRIALLEQRAAFDAATLRALGRAAQASGGLGEWKALIHPDDVDLLVREVQRVLEGEATPRPCVMDYRLQRADGSWLGVRSDEISVELDRNGRPCAVNGRFRIDEKAGVAPAAEAGEQAAMAPAAPAARPDALAEHCQTALARWGRDADGTIRLRWCNAAFAALEGVAIEELNGRSAAELASTCDGFALEDALARVDETGIAETRDAMLLARSDPPAWRRHQLSKLPDDEVLLELSELGELMQARHARRTRDELARYVMRSLPFTTLLLDEHCRVVQCVALSPGPLGEDAGAIEERTLAELLGPAAGAACAQQIARTLNTGRTATAAYRLEDATGHLWVECHSALLRALPGMPPRVLLGVLDVSSRVQELHAVQALGEQLRAALHSLPLPFYLKDPEGRYTSSNAAFERLMGVEAGMLTGKTDFEIFPDDLAAELHATERRLLDDGEYFVALRSAGVGEARAAHWCFEFPVRDTAGLLLGCGGLWIAPDELPAATRGGEFDKVTASVVNRLEDAITDNGDYAHVLRDLEQLVETTMQAQALIHNVAGHAMPPPSRPLVALAPLAQEIVELERILVPPGAQFENHIDLGLPPARCEPVAFHQILLRGIRHARRMLGPDGALCIRLRSSTGGGRGCISCRQDIEGSYVELVIEDTASRLADADIDQLLCMPQGTRAMGSALDDLAEIHALAHAQGGHMQIQRNVPSGTSVQVFFRAGDPAELNDSGRARSTVTRLPLGRGQGRS